MMALTGPRVSSAVRATSSSGGGEWTTRPPLFSRIRVDRQGKVRPSTTTTRRSSAHRPSAMAIGGGVNVGSGVAVTRTASRPNRERLDRDSVGILLRRLTDQPFSRGREAPVGLQRPVMPLP